MKYSHHIPEDQPTLKHAVMHSAVRRMSISDLVEGSEAVVLGSVLSVAGLGEARINGLDVTIPFTDVRIAVTEYITQKLSFSEIKVRTLGGTTPNTSFEAPEEPSFSAGEEVVLFICKDTGNLFDLPDDTFTVQGLFQGKYSIIRRDRPVIAVGAEGRTALPLEALIEEVQNAEGAYM